jgi:hypothetical protein
LAHNDVKRDIRDGQRRRGTTLLTHFRRRFISPFTPSTGKPTALDQKVDFHFLDRSDAYSEFSASHPLKTGATFAHDVIGKKMCVFAYSKPA